MEDEQARIRALSDTAIKSGDPLGWFEQLYVNANGDEIHVPWAYGEANPLFTDWYNENNISGGNALVVGCGLGEEAAFLAEEGWHVTAFDISSTAIEWAKSNFEGLNIEWVVADMQNLPEEWELSFDIVLEIHVLQAIPEDIREKAKHFLSPLVRDGGCLVCIGRFRGDGPEPEGPPWPLTGDFIESIGKELKMIGFDILRRVDDEPEVRRFRCVWTRSIS